MDSSAVSKTGARRPTPGGVLIVIPCLNEAPHIGRLLGQFGPWAAARDAVLVVVDGGSTDGTRQIAADRAMHCDAIKVMDNPDRIQSAGVNAAVKLFGAGRDVLIRLDAHADYPADYLDVLLDERQATGADSVVVSMIARGERPIQRVNAVAQNAPVGNGNSKHRCRTEGAFVDHGHHALMTLAAFCAVGGYDPGFTHNEDAELDHRLGAAGYRIWLTARTEVIYLPRTSFRQLVRQYYFYGKGRAQNLLKHRILPRFRQVAVIGVFPALLVGLAAPVHPVFGVPVLIWAGYCMGAGLRLAWQRRDPELILVGVSAILMHLAWSMGFWTKAMTARRPARERVT